MASTDHGTLPDAIPREAPDPDDAAPATALGRFGAWNVRIWRAYGRFTVRFWRGVFRVMRAAFDSTPPTRALANGYRRFARRLGRLMPKGLYARSLIIIIAPIVLLQAVVATVFMERHWQMVTRRLSAVATQDIAALVDLVGQRPPGADFADLARIADQRLALTIAVLPEGPLPAPARRPFFGLLDHSRSEEIERQIGRPFWVDTVGNPELVEVRVQLPDRTLQVFIRRVLAYPSNTHIFIVWMVGSSLVLLGIAILFLRNQIVPIERLADAAEKFGKGRPAPEFRPRGAREVRRASAAFLEMRQRIERHVEQRTTMLAGVSHDLRTILTRFRLQLAVMGDSPDTEELRGDVDEMHRMLEGYLAFARGDAGEVAVPTDAQALLERVAADADAQDAEVAVEPFRGAPIAILRPVAFRRCLTNLVLNACRHARRVAIAGVHEDGWLTVTVDDDGPGIPADQREAVFKPFYRLDEARNLDQSGTGLGLPIARDIARGHGGDIAFADSELGGLRAVVRIPG